MPSTLSPHVLTSLLSPFMTTARIDLPDLFPFDPETYSASTPAEATALLRKHIRARIENSICASALADDVVEHYMQLSHGELYDV